MSLATILVVCALVASPSAGGADGSRALVMAQESQPAQDSPQTASPPEPSKPPDQTQPEQTKPEPSSAPSQTQAPSAQPENPQQPDSTAKKPAAATATKKHRRKRKPAAQPGSGPTKTVVPNGSAPDSKAQIAPSLTEEQASHQRQNTTQLLASTDANLKKLSGRPLSPSQQDMVKQTQTYMEQAKAAEAAGDLQSARNLAFKAHLLSDELVKH